MGMYTSYKGKKRGRAKGGITMAINKELKREEKRKLDKRMMEISFWNNNKKWKIVTVYSQDMEETLKR